ncbi:hypothetical protein BV898_16642 [Hypsibius exemplaris]|uniref:Neurogenic mastermind-like N-terminal domain-containing protein n=1 Tax=Hypsibius exemplaris TaxID=2072580 RepID=A0A9X6NFQ9_HYPEX|nr:hypothetical protein BV898_16642 [Hypsibius exemplaris]
MHGKYPDGYCESEHQSRLHHNIMEESPHPVLPQYEATSGVEMYLMAAGGGTVTVGGAANSKKKAAKAKFERRFGIMKAHDKEKKEHFGHIIGAVYTKEIEEAGELGKKFLETKAKKTKKDKGDKNAKKGDVLSVSVINDQENKSNAAAAAAAFHRTNSNANNAPSVNGNGLSSPGGGPHSIGPSGGGCKSDPFDRDLPSNATSDSHHSGGGGGGLHPADFNRFLSSGEELPDLLGPGLHDSLDELLPNTYSATGADPDAAFDVGGMLDEMSHEITGEFRQQLDSLDFFTPDTAGVNSFSGGGREVKNESTPGAALFLDELSGFPGGGADATGTTFSARSAHLLPSASAAATTTGLTGPLHLTQQHLHHHSHNRAGPDVRSTLDTKRLAQDEATAMMQQQQQQMMKQAHQQNLLIQQQQQQQQRQMQLQYQLQKPSGPSPISPLFPGDGAGSQQGMCFSPLTEMSAGYPTGPGMGGAGYGAMPSGHRQAGYDATAMGRGGGGGGPPPVMRMNQGSPGAVLANGGRWVGGGGGAESLTQPPLSYHQQKQMSLVSGAEQQQLPYGAVMHSTGQMAGGAGGGGPGKPGFLQGAPGYPPNPMQQQQQRAQGLPGPYSSYMNGGGGAMPPRPQLHMQQQQYRTMMSNGQPGQAPGKNYPGGGVAGSPYAGHMQPAYHNAMEQQQAQQQQQAQMRQMAGYRPTLSSAAAYTAQQQQPVPVQQQQHQPTSFLTSSSINLPGGGGGATQQPQSGGFYATTSQQNGGGFPHGDAMQYSQQPDNMYGGMYGSSS